MTANEQYNLEIQKIDRLLDELLEDSGARMYDEGHPPPNTADGFDASLVKGYDMARQQDLALLEELDQHQRKGQS